MLLMYRAYLQIFLFITAHVKYHINLEVFVTQDQAAGWRCPQAGTSGRISF